MATNKNFEVKNGLTIAGTERISSAGAFTGSLASATTATTQSATDNSTKIATTAYTDAAITAVIGGAPGTLDTLNELAAAINDDASYASTLTTALATKLPLAGGTLTGALVGTSVSAPGGFLNGANGGIRIHTGGTKFFNVTAANAARDNIMDIGASDARFKDLHLAGAVSSGSINNFKLLDLGSASMLITHTDRGTGTISSATHNTGFGYGAFNNLTQGDYNVAMGIEALEQNTTGSRNHAFGSYSLSSNVSGNYNTGCGYGTLNQNTASNNTAVGYEALLDSNTGGNNTGIGYRALTNNTTASGGVAIGYEAMHSNTTASNNIAIGYRALYSNQTGINNYAIGYEALLVATGAENVATGLLSGRYQTSANYNTFYGSRAGYQVTSSSNVCIGAYGASNLISGSGTVIIGYNAQPYTASTANEIIIGFACQGVGAGRITMGVSSGSDRIYNNPSSNASWTRVSDERYKDEIQDNTDCGLKFINDLRPVTFKFKALADIDESLPDYDKEATERKHEEKHYGLIAQEVKKAMDDNNITDFAGWDNCSGIEAISQEMFVHPLIKAVQELSKELDAAKARITELEG